MRILDNSIYSSNAVPCGGAEGSFFFTISSKNATCRFNICNCVQDISNDSASFTFTGKERDEETGYSYFNARYLDHEILTSFLLVDRYADKYPGISPYSYCAWNPIVLMDPSGDTIINQYLRYKNSSGYGGELYARTQQLIDNFQAEHPDEFEILNNLSFTDPFDENKSTPVNIVVGVSDKKGPTNPETGRPSDAQTIYAFDYSYTDYCDESGKRTEKKDIVGIRKNIISITLYKHHHDMGSLANEFGDALFAVTRPKTVEEQRKMIYDQRATTQFSYHYESFIKGERIARPNPFDYK